MINVLIDTGFWFAKYKETDQYHEQAMKILLNPQVHYLLLPFPSFYEVFNTRFCKRQNNMRSLSAYLGNFRKEYIQDDKYRDKAFEITWVEGVSHKFPKSMVDNVIRGILDDTSIKVDALLTFNIEDFSDICAKKRIEIISC
jgi:hypothetical protein